MSGDNASIEQLWYTWSDMGINLIRVGFRIRAASPGLSDPRSEIVQSLDRYQRYALPRDADNTIPPANAPVCLALINTERGRILVHKVYTGRDGVGRYGAFFVHLLANLPAEFSAVDAIALWNAKPLFWRVSDDVGQQPRHSTQLSPLALSTLIQAQAGAVRDPQHNETIEKYLPYVIEAYLAKHLLTGSRNGYQDPRKIFIAANDAVIAEMLTGMAHSLAPQLLKNLTFSTYERDVSEAITEIVGTCWISEPMAERNQLTWELLPPDYLQQQLAVNCYSGKYTPLEQLLPIGNYPFIAQCAKDATSYFLTGVPQEFEDLLAACKGDPDLTFLTFLQLYESEVVRAKNPSAEDVVLALTPTTPAGYERSSKKLLRQKYQEKLIEQLLMVPGWWKQYRAAVSTLRTRSSQLAQVLQTISEGRAQLIAVELVKREAPRLAKNQATNPALEGQFVSVVDLMRCATPPEQFPDLWISLLKKLLPIKNSSSFFRSYKNAYTDIMQICAIVRPPAKLMGPLLTIPWTDFGHFLTLNLPFEWVEIATEQLVFESPPPSRETVVSLGQNYHSSVLNLLQQLALKAQHLTLATALFDILITGQYQHKLSLFYALLDSPMGKVDNTVLQLLMMAKLTVSEQAIFIERYSPNYLPNDKMIKMARKILSMFDELVSKNLLRDKMPILFSWLGWLDSPNSSQFALWFGSSTLKKSQDNLTEILNAAHLNPQECGEFFQRYGKKIISRYPSSDILLILFGHYVVSATSSAKLRLEILSMWLELDWLNLHLDEMLLKLVLNAARLTPQECGIFFQKYGQKFISLYPSSDILLSFFNHFATSGAQSRLEILSMWLEFNIGEQMADRVLSAARLNPQESGTFFQKYGQKFIPLYPSSDTLLNYFEASATDTVTSRSPFRLEVLNTWLKLKLQQKTLERVLNAAHLNANEQRKVLLDFGVSYLTTYPHSLTLVKYTQEFLDYLSTADIAIFKNRQFVGKPSAEEQFLAFLDARKLLSRQQEQELCHHWYIAAQYIRNPEDFSAGNGPERVVGHIGALLFLTQGNAHENLILELVPICLSGDHIAQIIKPYLTRIDMEHLLYFLAENAKAYMRQHTYSTADLVPFLTPRIQLAFRFRADVQEENGPGTFVNRYLDMLLEDISKETLDALDMEARQWLPNVRSEWEYYISTRKTPSWISIAVVQAPRSIARLVPIMRRSIYAVLAVLIFIGLIYPGPASAQVILTVAAYNYSQSLTLKARILDAGKSLDQKDMNAGILAAKQNIKKFDEEVPMEAATDSLKVAAKDAICITNNSGNLISIPAGVDVKTQTLLYFSTTHPALIAPHSSCTQNPLLIPIQPDPAANPGAKADPNTLTAFSSVSLGAIAKDNNMTIDKLSQILTVNNADNVKGGGQRSVPSITDQDLNRATVDLNVRLDADIESWKQDLSKDNAVGTPKIMGTQPDLPPSGTLVDSNSSTFSATIEETVTILSVSTIDLQHAVSPQLQKVMSKDQAYTGYTFAASPTVAITQYDPKTLQLKVMATGVATASINEKDVKNQVIGNSFLAAKNRIQSNIHGVQNVDVQITRGFFPWVATRWSDHISVKIVRGQPVNSPPEK